MLDWAFNRRTPSGMVSIGSQATSESQVPQPEEDEVAEDEVADMRARIYAGMKRYFHTKSNAGLLSHRVSQITLVTENSSSTEIGFCQRNLKL